MLQPITKQNFTALISQYSTSELENLVVKFPYVREAHILLAKKYQLENNPKFDQQLQLAALYADDRELLFTLFADKTIEESIFEGVTVNIETEVKEAAAIIETETAQPEKETPLEEIDSIETIELTSTTTETTEEVLASPEEEKEEAISPPATLRSFDEWISTLSSFTIARSEPKTQDPELIARQEAELNKTIMESVPVAHLYERVDEETHYSRGLDQFIEEQISKRRKGEPKKPAAQDELDPEMITETMARIYEMQKKYTKAIKAYEILALKFPEKNDFFAARINYLKNII